MCCLTIYRNSKDELIFTHNRDESIRRPLGFAKLAHFKIANSMVWMPVDPVSNGTWIATDGHKCAAILNGYGNNHVKKETYSQSRGTIIPAFFESKNIDLFISEFDPSGLEPFTLILHQNGQGLYELGWNERELTQLPLDDQQAHIYSSVTLYNNDVIESRKKMFMSMVKDSLSMEDIWAFHLRYGNDHHHFINVRINDHIQTVATSQIVLGKQATFSYIKLWDEDQEVLNHLIVKELIQVEKS